MLWTFAPLFLLYSESPIEKLGIFLLFVFQLGFFPVNFVIIFGERLSVGDLIFILSYCLKQNTCNVCITGKLNIVFHCLAPVVIRKNSCCVLLPENYQVSLAF